MRTQAREALQWRRERGGFASLHPPPPFVDPTFKTNIDALIATSNIEERVKWRSWMVTPLCYAMNSTGCLDAVDSLLAAGARLEPLSVFLLNTNPHTGVEEEETLEKAFFGACRARSPGCIKAILDRGMDPNTKNSLGSTPLMVCFEDGFGELFGKWRMDVVNLLLDAGALVSPKNDAGENVFRAVCGGTHGWNRSDGFTVQNLYDVLMASYIKENAL